MRKIPLTVVAVLIIGIGLTTTAGVVSHQALTRVETEQTTLKAGNAAAAVLLALDRVTLVVQSVTALYAADSVTSEEFRRFAHAITINDGPRSLGFYRKVDLSARPLYEASMATESERQLGIWEAGPDGRPVHAADRPTYYVVEAGYLSDGTQPAVGLDVGSLPGRRQYIEEAIASNSLVVSRPLRFNNTDEMGVIIFEPTFNRAGVIVGVATATVTLKTLTTVASLASGAGNLVLRVVDKGTEAGTPPPKDVAAVEPAGAEAADVEADETRTFEYGGNTWSVSILPEPAPGGARWLVFLVVAGGLATTAAVIAYIVGRRNAREAEDARADLRLMLDRLGPLVWLLDSDGNVIAANRATREAIRREPDNGAAETLWSFLDGEGRGARLRDAVAQAVRGKELRFDLVVHEGTEHERVFDLWLRPLPGSNADDTIRIVASAVDVTDRYEGERAQNLLMRELDHRMKNTLQVLQAIIRRTAQSQGSVRSFEQALIGRIAAMSRSHELLAEQRWIGADIAVVIRQETASFSAGGGVTARGPTLRLAPRAAISLGLVIHELGTNAAKYGALSSSSGTVAISWAVEREGGEPRLVLRWTEDGGPPVDAPERRGFGSMLIERSITYELDGEASLDFRREGLTCTISMPLRTVLPSVSRDEPHAAEPVGVAQ